MTEFEHGNEEDWEGRPSKSQRKRDMVALQKLGESLIELAPEQLGRLDLHEDLVEAIRFFHTLKDKEAKRRQQQFIGTVMRKIDPVPLREALDELDQLRFQQAEAFHQIEIWRDALVDGDGDVMTELVGRFGLDPQQLRQLAKQAAAEKAAGKPAKNGRALFRLLRQSFEREQAED
ncbi:ribosome-associated protein [Desulfomicrobium macestii]|uniref:Ribosome-associated protein n=2 Tax=Desulfomicrobium TaxID=898 RepID=A0A8G2BZP6_DESNO|nr:MULTISPECIES: ribosome biogenesis factor YjgA [Desulfomicrobium]MBE1426987.1 ribosome-associated protein [Desulfomicrobium macestii]SFL27119.1 ribosome-associated protein [Desulfomicrobium norvegicum]